MKRFIFLLTVTAILLSATYVNASQIITIGKQSNYSISNQFLLGNSYQQSLEFTTDEIIIKFKEDLVVETTTYDEEPLVTTSIDSVDLLNANYGVYSYQKLKVDEDTLDSSLSNIYKLKVPDGSNILSIIEEYKKEPSIEFVEPNYIVYLCDDFSSQGKTQSIKDSQNDLEETNDEYFEKQWGLKNNQYLKDINILEAWDTEKGDPNVVVAIIDSGIDYTHPDLAGNIWTNPREIEGNNIDDDCNGFIDDVRGWNFEDGNNDPIDYFGHGTHCAGIVSAVTDNNIGIAGVTQNCKIMPVKVLGDGNSETWEIANGIIYAADNGADVISMSIGFLNIFNGYIKVVRILHNAINHANDKGVVLVAAAGNSGKPICTYPGSDELVISVGSISKDGSLSYFSSYGPNLDVVAPGDNIISTLPSYEDFLYNKTYGKSPYYDYLSGTSMACPYVAGVAALLRSYNGALSNYKVRQILQDSTEDLGISGYDWIYGYGLVDAGAALEYIDDHFFIEYEQIEPEENEVSAQGSGESSAKSSLINNIQTSNLLSPSILLKSFIERISPQSSPKTSWIGIFEQSALSNDLQSTSTDSNEQAAAQEISQSDLPQETSITTTEKSDSQSSTPQETTPTSPTTLQDTKQSATKTSSETSSSEQAVVVAKK